MANGENGGSFVTGFLLGGVVGAIVGILVAPRSGAETRAQLLDQSEVLRERAEEMAARMRDNVGPTVDSVREHVNPAMETVRDRVAPMTEAVAARVPGLKADSVDGAESAAQAEEKA